jgi:hypothetical protein
MKFAVVACSLLLATAATAADRPSRSADKGCAWRQLSDPTLGLEAWVQHCTHSVKEDGVPDPPCGELGTQPDSVQYFEVQPASGSRKVMLVDAGQDVPLFDEETLRLLPSKK